MINVHSDFNPIKEKSQGSLVKLHQMQSIQYADILGLAKLILRQVQEAKGWYIPNFNFFILEPVEFYPIRLLLKQACDICLAKTGVTLLDA